MTDYQTSHCHVVYRIEGGGYHVEDAQFIPADLLFMEAPATSVIAQRERAARWREANREQERERVRAYRATKGAT